MTKIAIPRRFLYPALTCVTFFWGTSFAAAKIGLQDLAPMNLVTLRFIIASIIFGLLLGTLPGKNRIERRDIPRFFLLGFLAITSYFYIQYSALLYTTTINAALIVSISPIFTAMMDLCAGREKFRPPKSAGIALAFVGVTLIINHGSFSGIFQSSTLLGDCMLLLNALVWAGYTSYGSAITQKYSPFTATAYIHIFGTIMLVPLALISTPLSSVTLPAQLPNLSMTGMAAAFYLAVLCSVYAYYVWYEGVSALGAVSTSVFSYLNPLFAILAGIAFMGEELSWNIIGGGLLVISGVYLTNLKEYLPNETDRSH